MGFLEKMKKKAAKLTSRNGRVRQMTEDEIEKLKEEIRGDDDN